MISDKLTSNFCRRFSLQVLQWDFAGDFGQTHINFLQMIFIAGAATGGDFGQPHIVTKFMGIKQVSHIKKSMLVGMSWQLIALGSATAIGLIAIPYFSSGIANPELVFVQMVKNTFPPIIMAFILCGVLGECIL